MIIVRLRDLMRDRDGNTILSLTTGSDLRETFDELKDKDLKLELKEYKPGRSLDANNYCWLLVDLITKKLQQKEPKSGWTKTLVYRNAIREIGGVSDSLMVRTEAVWTFKKIWERDHLGRQVEVLGPSDRIGWTDVQVYYGSSEYDSAQMSALISGLIQEAEGLGIPTLTDKEVDKLLGKWGKRYERKHSAE